MHYLSMCITLCFTSIEDTACRREFSHFYNKKYCTMMYINGYTAHVHVHVYVLTPVTAVSACSVSCKARVYVMYSALNASVFVSHCAM